MSDFDEFWEAYPRKKAKAVARKAFAKVNGKAAMIIEDVKNRVENDPAWADRSFIPYPSTYLNQERWEDSIEVVVPRDHDDLLAYAHSHNIPTRGLSWDQLYKRCCNG